MNRASVVIPLVGLVVIFGTIGQTMVKHAVNSIPINASVLAVVLHFTRSGWFYAGVAFAGVGFVIWLFVLASADLSFATPFLALAFPLILISSIFILHEPVSFLRLSGTLIVAIGMLMVAMS